MILKSWIEKTRNRDAYLYLKEIDKIAREKQRDVLFVTFNEQGMTASQYDSSNDELPFDWEARIERKELINFLEADHIPHRCCFPAQPTNGTLILVSPYEGELYIDIPYDDSDPLYRKLEEYLENPDGSMKIPDVNFWLYPLDMAMENAEHDEPGFWDNM